jgi:hypothetical protein
LGLDNREPVGRASVLPLLGRDSVPLLDAHMRKMSHFGLAYVELCLFIFFIAIGCSVIAVLNILLDYWLFISRNIVLIKSIRYKKAVFKPSIFSSTRL